MIIPKHRRQAAAYLTAKGLPDPFIDLPEKLDPDIKLPPDWEAMRLELNKNQARVGPAANPGNAAAGPTNAQPRPRPPPPTSTAPQAGLSQAAQAAARKAGTSNVPPGWVPPRPPGYGTPNAQRPTPPLTAGPGKPRPKPAPQARPVAQPAPPPPAAGAVPQPMAKTSAGTTPVPSRPSSEAPGQTGQAGTRPPVMAPGGKYSWAQVFSMSEAGQCRNRNRALPKRVAS